MFSTGIVNANPAFKIFAAREGHHIIGQHRCEIIHNDSPWSHHHFHLSLRLMLIQPQKRFLL